MATETHGQRNSPEIWKNVTTSDPTVTDDSNSNYAAGSIWINTTKGLIFKCRDASVGAAVWDVQSKHAAPLTTYIDVKSKNSETNIHGGLLSLSTGDALDSVPTDINVTTGLGKLMIVVNAGSDLAGDITVTGTSVDRETGAETASDTDTITVDAVTTDGSDTDASGNTRHSFTGAYITSKWFLGALTLSTTNLTLTDVDTYHVSFEQMDDVSSYVMDTFDVNAYATNASAWLYAYLYSLVVSGDKCNVVREASLELPAAKVTANRYYRLRRGNIGQIMAGASDGLWVDMFLGPLANTYWEDITTKVWLL